MTFAELRREYLRATLNEADVDRDPFKQFEKWFQEAVKAQISFPDAMTLATVTAQGTPDARIVLLKGIEGDGFCFFTNYLSAKGRQLEINPSATLLFFWPELERQVRIKGTVRKISESDSDEYFLSRPIGAQLASSISRQSEVVESRASLESALKSAEDKNTQTPVKRPPHWGGYVLNAREFEFWQGRESRLHDRIRYRLNPDKSWSRARLAP